MGHHFGHGHGHGHGQPRKKRQACDNFVPDCDVPCCDGCDVPGCDGCDVCDCNLSVFRLFRLSSLLLAVSRLTPDHRRLAGKGPTGAREDAARPKRAANAARSAGHGGSADTARSAGTANAARSIGTARSAGTGGLPVVDRAGLAAIAAYRRWVSPRVAPRCRFTPTCSAYGSQAVARHGMRDGLRLTADRLRRCGGSVPPGTIDPVPQPPDLVADAGR